MSITPSTAFTGNTLTITWSGMAVGDVGLATGLAPYTEWSAQFTGTFGAGGEGRLEGRSGALDFGTLRTLGDDGDAVFTDSRPAEIVGHPLEVRPRISAGDASTLLTVVIAAGDRGAP